MQISQLMGAFYSVKINLSLWPFLLVLCHVPLLIYVNLMPLVHHTFERFIFPSGVENRAEFDFIVIGAGSAGSVVAGRLAEHGHQVLLLEAGPPANWFMTIPYICAIFQKTPYDWQYTTEPQKHGEFRLLKGESNNQTFEIVDCYAARHIHLQS